MVQEAWTGFSASTAAFPVSVTAQMIRTHTSFIRDFTYQSRCK